MRINKQAEFTERSRRNLNLPCGRTLQHKHRPKSGEGEGEGGDEGRRTNDLTNPEILKVCHASFIKQFYNDLDIYVEDDRGHVCAMQNWRITCRISFK